MEVNSKYDIKIGQFKKMNGDVSKIAYIVGETPEDTKNIKDTLKTKFKALWLTNVKAWGWFLGKNPEYVLQNIVRPAVEYLNSIGNENSDTIKEKEKIENLLNNLIEQINNSDEINIETKNDIKNKLETFKNELINELSSEEFFEKIKLIIDFGRRQDHKYSFLNTLLIFLQDPKATNVKSTSVWATYNRKISSNAKPIFLFIPKGQHKYTKVQRDKMIKDTLEKANVKSIDDLPPGLRHRLDIALRGYGAKTFDYVPYFYDVRFTEVMEGKEDIIDKEAEDKKKLEWYDATSEVTEKTEKLSNALISFIEKSGVKISYTDSLDGARGVSTSGEIKLLTDAPHNKGFFNDICHEFSHELLHQDYLKMNNKELGNYFIGKKQGRAVVEQQAELSAWIVLRTFGFEMPTAINYVGIWGLRKENAAEVFDTVARAAEKIIRGINNELKDMNEAKKSLFEISGLDVAKMIGMEDIYMDSARKNKNKEKVTITNEDIEKMVYESITKILKSKK